MGKWRESYRGKREGCKTAAAAAFLPCSIRRVGWPHFDAINPHIFAGIKGRKRRKGNVSAAAAAARYNFYIILAAMNGLSSSPVRPRGAAIGLTV